MFQEASFVRRRDFKTSEKTLKELEKLGEKLGFPFFILEGENFSYLNPAGKKLTGYTASEIKKINFWKVFSPDCEEIARKICQHLLPDKTPASHQLKIVRKDGKERWVEISLSQIETEEKKVFLGTAYDLNDIKKSEEELRRTNSELSVILSAISELVCLIDCKRKILWCNQSTIDFLKEDFKNLIGKKICSFFHPRTNNYKECPFKKALKSGKREEGVFKFNKSLFSISVIPLFDRQGKLKKAVHIINLSRQVQTEEELKEKEAFFSRVFDSVQDGISILDSQLNILMTNKTMEKWYSYALPLKGKKCYQAYQSQKNPCGICPTIQALKTGKAAYEVVPKRAANGEIVGWLDLYAFPLFAPGDDKVTSVVEYVRDITPQKEAEEKLKHLNRLITLLAKAKEAIIRATQEKKLLNKIVKLIAEIEGFDLTWIAYPESERKIRLVAREAKEANFFKSLKIATSDAQKTFPLSWFLTSPRKVYLCQNLKTKTTLLKGEEVARESGFSSLVIFPLIFKNQTLGWLGILSCQTQAFKKAEKVVLKELAADLAMGISSLRARKEKEQTQKKLVETVIKLRKAEKRAQELSRKIIEAHEKERLYLATEIHDQLLQSLVATYYFLEVIDFSAFPKKVQEQKEELRKVLKSSIEEGRALLKKIEPPREKEISLGQALEEALRINFAGTQIKTHLHLPKSSPHSLAKKK